MTLENQELNNELEQQENRVPTEELSKDYKVNEVEQSDKDKRAAAALSWELSQTKQFENAKKAKDTGAEEYKAPVVDISNHTKSNNLFRKVRNFTLATLLGLSATKSSSAMEYKDSTDKPRNVTESTYNGNEKVDDVIRGDWNNYHSWLESKGMAGKPELDKGGLGYKLFDEYVATHETSLSRETLDLVRKELLKLRASKIKEINEGKAHFADGVDEEHFMASIVRNEATGDPNYPGFNFTRFIFPTSKTITLDQATVDYNKVSNKAIDSKLKGTITDVMSDEKKVVKITNNGFVKSGDQKNTPSSTEVAKNNK